MTNKNDMQTQLKHQRNKAERNKKSKTQRRTDKKQKKKVYTVYIYTAYILYNVIIIKNNIEEKRKHTYDKLNKEKQIECTSKIRKSNTI